MKTNRRSAFRIMWQLTGLLKGLWSAMLFAITTGVLGFILSFTLTLFGAYAILHIMKFPGLEKIIFGDWSLKAYFWAMGISAFGRGFLHYVEQYCNHYLAFHILADIRVQLFSILRGLAPAKTDGKKQGDLIAMLTADIELLEVFYAHTLSPIFIAIFTALALLAYYTALSWIYAVYAIFAIALVGIVIPIFASKKASSLGMQLREQMADLNGEYLDSLRGLREILQYQQEEKALKKMKNLTESITKLQRKLRQQMAELQVWTDTAIMLLSTGQVLLSLYLLREGRVSVPAAILAGVLQLGSFAPFINLANLGNILSQTLACGERVLSLMEEEPAVDEREEGEDLEAGRIVLDNVSFDYGEEGILEDFSLEVKEGEILGIMGASGCGKSTILKLILRFWDPKSGTISLGGKDISQGKRSSLHAKMNYMTQESNLFTTTLRDNLRIAKADASDEEIYEALEKASLLDFVKSLPEGLDSYLEEGGKNVSGGEKQRIGLARAFLAQRPIYLLDEPTSNLDAQNEAIILKSLLREREGKTMILVSHRASTLGICDRIIKIKK